MLMNSRPRAASRAIAPLLWVLLLAPPALADTVRIGWLRGTNDITLGKARGTIERALAAHGDRVEWDGPFQASAPAVEAMNAGAIDITVGSSTSVVTSLAAGAPVVVFAYQKMSPAAEAIIVQKDSPLHSLADLAGHSVAVNRGGTGEYLLVRALTTHGVDPARVKRIYLGPADAAVPFRQGDVDAWATWDPFLTIALQDYGARVLADGAAIGSDNAVVLLARKGFVAQHRDLLETLFQAVEADNAWSVANPVAAGEVWARAMNLPPSEATALGTDNAVPTIPVGPAQVQQMDRIADWYVQNRIVPTRPAIAANTVELAP
jgi:sulfonate transport system substrate-binding protein